MFFQNKRKTFFWECDFHLCKYHAIPWVISRSSNNHLMFNRRCQGSDCLAAGGWDLSTLEPFSFGALCQHRVLHRFGRGRPSNSLVQISVLRQGRKHRQCDPIWLGEGNIHWTGIHTVSSIQSLIRPLQFQQRVLYHLQCIYMYMYIYIYMIIHLYISFILNNSILSNWLCFLQQTHICFTHVHCISWVLQNAPNPNSKYWVKLWMRALRVPPSSPSCFAFSTASCGDHVHIQHQ